jgi:hypothetical protein
MNCRLCGQELVDEQRHPLQPSGVDASRHMQCPAPPRCTYDSLDSDDPGMGADWQCALDASHDGPHSPDKPAAQSDAGGRGAATQGLEDAPLVVGGSTGLDGWVREPSAADAEAGRREALEKRLTDRVLEDALQQAAEAGDAAYATDFDRDARDKAHRDRLRKVIVAALAGAPHGDAQAGTAAEEK